jgi:hypothetical protein
LRLLKFFPKFTGVLVVLGFHTADGVLEFVEQALVLTLKFGYQVSLAAVILPELRYFSLLIIYPLIQAPNLVVLLSDTVVLITAHGDELL